MSGHLAVLQVLRMYIYTIYPVYKLLLCHACPLQELGPLVALLSSGAADATDLEALHTSLLALSSADVPDAAAAASAASDLHRRQGAQVCSHECVCTLLMVPPCNATHTGNAVTGKGVQEAWGFFNVRVTTSHRSKLPRYIQCMPPHWTRRSLRMPILYAVHVCVCA
jgi:hypothetical protein